MPIFDYECKRCGDLEELYVSHPDKVILCTYCGQEKDKLFTGSYQVKWKHPSWVDRVDDYQKRQEDNGITPTLPHPSQVL